MAAEMHAVRAVEARRLVWEFPAQGLAVQVEVHQLTAAQWRDRPELEGQGWHAVPAQVEGYLIVARATITELAQS